MGAIFGLIGGIKGVAIIGLIIAVLGWAALQRSRVTQANLARDQALVQRDQTAGERDKAISAAKVNAETIDKLKEEKRLVDEALISLQTSQEQNRTTTAAREIIIQQQERLPTNTTKAAPVIGSIIAQIQADRLARRGNGVVPTPSSAPSTPQAIRQ